MAKIEAHIGLTLRATKNNDFQFVRPEIGISEIDTDGDIDKQLKQAVVSLDKLWETITSQAEEKIISNAPVLDLNVEAQLKTQLTSYKIELDKITSDMVELKKLFKSSK